MELQHPNEMMMRRTVSSDDYHRISNDDADRMSHFSRRTTSNGGQNSTFSGIVDTEVVSETRLISLST
jgi:hypothetical protein